ncbi:hypothetical protein BDV98DRAFT_599043, partial [Pterulicium gracile]
MEYKAWAFLDLETHKVIYSERAEFDERYFPGLKKAGRAGLSADPPLAGSPTDMDLLDDMPELLGEGGDGGDDAPPAPPAPGAPVALDAPNQAPPAMRDQFPSPAPAPTRPDPPTTLGKRPAPPPSPPAPPHPPALPVGCQPRSCSATPVAGPSTRPQRIQRPPEQWNMRQHPEAALAHRDKKPRTQAPVHDPATDYRDPTPFQEESEEVNKSDDELLLKGLVANGAKTLPAYD